MRHGITAHLGNHPNFGRLVFEFPAPVGFHVVQAGDQVTIRFDSRASIADVPGPARNIRRVTGGAGQAVITIEAGSHVHTTQRGRRIVIDILDAQPAQPEPAKMPYSDPLAPSSETPIAHMDRVPDQSAVTPTPLPATQLSPPPTPRVAAPAVPGSGSLALLATRLSRPGQDGSAMLVPFGPEVGAAAFRAGGQLQVVFDTPRPIDLSGLTGDAVFGHAQLHLLTDATLLSLQVGDAQAVQLERRPGGWQIDVGDPELALKPIQITSSGPTLTLEAAAPSRVVVVRDPTGGSDLLIGTQRESGQGVGLARKASEFTILETLLGVAVEPASDRITLRPLADRFVLGASGEPPLALPPASLERQRSLDAAAFATRVNFPSLPREALLHRLDDQLAAAATAPALGRYSARIAAATTMLALGLDAEAQGVLLLARREGPEHASDPEAAFLSGIAALLAGRPNETEGLMLRELDGSDDVALWRAVRAAMLNEGSPDAAEVFAADAGLLLSYSPPLRERLLPLAAETMAQAGPAGAKAAQAMINRVADEAELTFARGLLARQSGDIEGALLVFDTLGQGRDRLVRARAARAAIELRLQAGRIDVATAADAMERQIVAWRGDEREESVRLRASELRAQAGNIKAALALLRETATLFPDNRPAIQERAALLLSRLIEHPSATPVPALDMISMVEENATLLPTGNLMRQLAPRLADLLVALDLPARAGPVLEKLMNAAGTDPTRATIGARLAELHLDQGDGAAALVALAASDLPGLPEPIQTERLLIEARAAARTGDMKRAFALLEGQHAPTALDLRASLLASAHDWAGALVALRELNSLLVPDHGSLDAQQQEIVLRTATVAAQAGDESTLRGLQASAGARLTHGPRNDLFQLLTAAPVKAAADLPRSAAEMVLARAAPGELHVVNTR